MRKKDGNKNREEQKKDRKGDIVKRKTDNYKHGEVR
jgi:hypothetical protein